MLYIYRTPPEKNLCSHHFCWYLQYFVSILGCLLILFFWGGVPYIYIYICARRLHDLFVHFERNAVRMRSMHSDCIPAQYQDQDLHRSLVENLGNTKTKIQDLHRSLVENLGNTKIQDPIPRFSTRLLCKSWILVLVFPRFSKSWILVLVFPRFSTRLLCKSWILVLVFPRFSNLGSWSWYFQDFPQDFCAHLGSWSWYWAGMHSLAFSGSDKIALSTF